jgi:hypothetical protein
VITTYRDRADHWTTWLSCHPEATGSQLRSVGRLIAALRAAATDVAIASGCYTAGDPSSGPLPVAGEPSAGDPSSGRSPFGPSRSQEIPPWGDPGGGDPRGSRDPGAGRSLGSSEPEGSGPPRCRGDPGSGNSRPGSYKTRCPALYGSGLFQDRTPGLERSPEARPRPFTGHEHARGSSSSRST